MLIRYETGPGRAYPERRGAARSCSCSGIGFMVGIGCFDYWGRYIIGARRGAEDHSDHGAYSWRDYFKVNTDHKVIGIQYLVTTFIFFLIGGLLAEGVRAELATPGTAVLLAGDVQRPVLGARGADDLPVRHPGLRRPRELRDAADARRRGHGLPAAERALASGCCPTAGDDHGGVVPGRRPSTPAGRTTRRSRCTGRSAQHVLQHGRAVRRRLVDPDGRQLHRHDPDDARAGHDASGACRCWSGPTWRPRRWSCWARRSSPARSSWCCSTASCTRTSSTRRTAAT